VRPDEYLHAIVLAAFAHALFGLDPERDAAEVRVLASAHAALEREGLAHRLSATGRAAFDELGAVIHRHARRRGADVASGDGPVCALSELARLDPTMPDDTCVDNLILMLKIGSSNVLGLLRWLVKMLGDHPVWLDRLRADLHGGQLPPGPRLVDRLVMEALRLEQSEYLYRRVQTRFRHDGVEFPAGWQVRLCVRESHRRGDVFEAPDRFNPDRFLARPYTKTEYSPFGTGSHACNGVDLTSLVCRVTLEELARGFEMTLAQDGPPERDFRHWSHWRPSASLRVRIAPRPPA
jgi:cytochrome P450